MLQQDLGGGLSLEYCDNDVSNCVFYNNEAYFGGAFSEMYTINPTKSFSNFIMHGNRAGAFGGAIASLASEGTLYNNFTITNNYCGMGNAIFLSRASNPIFTNCIIRGNESGNATVWLWDQDSKSEFYNCNVEGGSTNFQGNGTVQVYEDNIDEDPQFIDVANFDFRLSENSLCIDAGKIDTSGLALPSYDYDMEKRIYNNRIDIGAFEFVVVGLNNYQITNNNITVSPNPLQENSRCEINLNQESFVTLKIYSLSGKLIWQNETTKLSQGKHSLSLNDFITKKQKSNTTYILVINTSQSKKSVKLIY
ncbi:T9SS type A sorting domain-containing protein [Bacteroidales bacterium OttesenSCG-928-L14]|nr:T9SS type A sorting domain-containing protein [Bacteroidales bacterium OttesenSCG-928-L14]